MIMIENLVKRYGAKNVVNNISFTVADGEIVGFLGPNGAGKSTTMNIITGYLSSTSGTVNVDGYDILDDAMEAKKLYEEEHPGAKVCVLDTLSTVNALVKGSRSACGVSRGSTKSPSTPLY